MGKGEWSRAWKAGEGPGHRDSGHKGPQVNEDADGLHTVPSADPQKMAGAAWRERRWRGAQDLIAKGLVGHVPDLGFILESQWTFDP